MKKTQSVYKIEVIRRMVRSNEDSSDVIPIKEAARLLKVETQAVSRMLDLGQLPWIQYISSADVPSGTRATRYTLRSAVERRLQTRREGKDAPSEEEGKPPNSANSAAAFKRSEPDYAIAMVGARVG